MIEQNHFIVLLSVSECLKTTCLISHMSASSPSRKNTRRLMAWLMTSNSPAQLDTFQRPQSHSLASRRQHPHQNYWRLLTRRLQPSYLTNNRLYMNNMMWAFDQERTPDNKSLGHRSQKRRSWLASGERWMVGRCIGPIHRMLRSQDTTVLFQQRLRARTRRRGLQ